MSPSSSRCWTRWRRCKAASGGPAAPHELLADRGYDHDKYRRLVWAEGVKPTIARRGTPHGSGLGGHRYVERTIALLHWFRWLRVRWEIRDDIHEALLTLAAAFICWRRLVR